MNITKIKELAVTAASPRLLAHQSHFLGHKYVSTFPTKSQVEKSRSHLLSELLGLCDFALEQERKALERALVSSDGQMQQHLAQAVLWQQGRASLLRAMLGEVGSDG